MATRGVVRNPGQLPVYQQPGGGGSVLPFGGAGLRLLGNAIAGGLGRGGGSPYATRRTGVYPSPGVNVGGPGNVSGASTGIGALPGLAALASGGGPRPAATSASRFGGFPLLNYFRQAWIPGRPIHNLLGRVTAPIGSGQNIANLFGGGGGGGLFGNALSSAISGLSGLFGGGGATPGGGGGALPGQVATLPSQVGQLPSGPGNVGGGFNQYTGQYGYSRDYGPWLGRLIAGEGPILGAIGDYFQGPRRPPFAQVHGEEERLS